MKTVLGSVALPALFATMLAGCASLMVENPPTPPNQDCKGECRVNVSVTCKFVMFCKVSVPDEVYAHGQNVFWDLDQGAHPSFQFDNRGKRGVCVNFDSAEGVEVFFISA